MLRMRLSLDFCCAAVATQGGFDNVFTVGSSHHGSRTVARCAGNVVQSKVRQRQLARAIGVEIGLDNSMSSIWSAIVQRAETLLSSKTSTWADLAVGLGVATGRGISELLGTERSSNKRRTTRSYLPGNSSSLFVKY